MRQREARWIDEVRPVPGGWVGKALLVALFVVLVVSDILNADVDLTDPQGWVELILPYIPLLALLAGAVSGAVAWIVMFAVFLSLGIPTEMLSASMIPMLITVGLVTYALPRVPAGIFSALALILALFAGLINPAIGPGSYCFRHFDSVRHRCRAGGQCDVWAIIKICRRSQRSQRSSGKNSEFRTQTLSA